MTAQENADIDSPVIDLTPASDSGGNGRRVCKFIIVEHEDRVRIVFGDLSAYKYHADLLHAYCEQHGIPSDWVHKPDLLEPLNSALDILGGGYLELNVSANTATFSGASKAYGPYHHHQLEAILANSPLFARMQIRISR